MSAIRRIAKTVGDGVRELRGQPAVFFTLCALAFVLMATYGLARPPAKSMFTDVYGSSRIAWAWLAVAVTTVVAASIYGRLVTRIATPRLFLGATIVLALMFTLLRIAIEASVPHAVFAMYVLMETYIVVLVESFWSLANLTYKLSSARVAYGLFLMCGSFGSMTAELLQPTLARSIGTVNILWLVAPILVICGVWCSRLGSARVSLAQVARSSAPALSRREGWRLLAKSRYLWLVLLIVAASQIAINLADYTLTASFEKTYAGPELRDARTAAFGTVYATINGAALALQLLTAPLVAALGVLPIFMAIPALVGGALATAWAVPSALTASVAFVTAKVLDYSLFRATKEMLYLPLDATAKTVGKSYVDMSTYRAAKAGASLLLLALVPLGASLVAGTAVALVAGWFACTAVLAPRYRAQLEDRERASPPSISS
jgi:AAA family ATP:ADP antiporter